MTIKSTPTNAVDFSHYFNRESKFFDISLQRKESIISEAAAYLSFFFQPTVMPGVPPVATIYFMRNDGTTLFSRPSDASTELTDGFIYFFTLETLTAQPDYFYVKVSGYDDIIYSEQCKYVAPEDFNSENVVKLIAWNNDDRHGYISTYKACGFFEISDLNSGLFGVEKTEYNYSYGRKKILSSENFIKTVIIFSGLTMYQRNLLQWLCNCENLEINGTAYELVSEFTEVARDENNEIYDLRAEFVEVNQSFFNTGATEVSTEIKPKNLFVK